MFYVFHLHTERLITGRNDRPGRGGKEGNRDNCRSTSVFFPKLTWSETGHIPMPRNYPLPHIPTPSSWAKILSPPCHPLRYIIDLSSSIVATPPLYPGHYPCSDSFYLGPQPSRYSRKYERIDTSFLQNLTSRFSKITDGQHTGRVKSTLMN